MFHCGQQRETPIHRYRTTQELYNRVIIKIRKEIVSLWKTCLNLCNNHTTSFVLLNVLIHLICVALFLYLNICVFIKRSSLSWLIYHKYIIYCLFFQDDKKNTYKKKELSLFNQPLQLSRLFACKSNFHYWSDVICLLTIC